MCVCVCVRSLGGGEVVYVIVYMYTCKWGRGGVERETDRERKINN